VDRAVIKYYRKLLTCGFEYAGSIDSPSVFLESRGEGGVCGRAADYMQIFINISKGRIDTIKYLCQCDPTANVAIEVLCTMIRGKTLGEVQAMTEDSLMQAVGTESQEMQNKARALLELVIKGIAQNQNKMEKNRNP